MWESDYWTAWIVLDSLSPESFKTRSCVGKEWRGKSTVLQLRQVGKYTNSLLQKSDNINTCKTQKNCHPYTHTKIISNKNQSKALMEWVMRVQGPGYHSSLFGASSLSRALLLESVWWFKNPKTNLVNLGEKTKFSGKNKESHFDGDPEHVLSALVQLLQSYFIL